MHRVDIGGQSQLEICGRVSGEGFEDVPSHAAAQSSYTSDTQPVPGPCGSPGSAYTRGLSLAESTLAWYLREVLS